MRKDATIVVKIEKQLKDLLQSVADDKGVTLSEYTRFVIGRGLDVIYERNKRHQELERQLGLRH
jgi:hypothetical protein